MSSKYELGTVILKNPVRLYWANLFDPEPYKEDGVAKGDPKFRAELIIQNDDPQLALLKSRVLDVAKAGGLGGAQRRLGISPKDGGLKHPFTKGTDRLARMSKTPPDDVVAALKDATIMVTTSGQYKPPALTTKLNGFVTDYELSNRHMAREYFYMGCNVRAKVYLNAYDGMGGGVNAYLNSLASDNTGEHLGAPRIPASEDFWGDLPTQDVSVNASLKTSLKKQLENVPLKIKKQFQDLDDDIPF